MLAEVKDSSHSAEKKISSVKHERNILHDFDIQCKEIRCQLAEQLKCVGERTEVQVSVLGELEEFVRRRGEAEAEHARSLDKIAKSIMQRHKNERNRREAWPQHTVCTAWQQLVDDTKAEAEQRAQLASLLSKKIAPSIVSRSEDLSRMSKKCREIGSLAHSEINRVLSELHTAIKTYQIVHSESRAAEKKMRIAEEELKKYEEGSKGGRGSVSRRQRNATKTFSKRLEKWQEVRLRSCKARNEYILCIHAANASLHKFYAEDLSALVDCADIGMDFWLQAILGALGDARKDLAMREMNSLADTEILRHSLDSRIDKQKFFESRPVAFMLPKPFEFRGALRDGESELKANDALAAELTQRQRQIDKRLEGLRFESDEVWKSLDACQKQMQQLYTSDEWDDLSKWRADLTVSMNYYTKKLEYFLLNGNLIERLETRSRSLLSALGESHPIAVTAVAADNGRVRRRPRRLLVRPNSQPRPKLFGCSLHEYVEVSGEEIPLIVTSSIAFLSKFALRHQGLFRISGSISEINRFREAFENGDDLVSELTDGSEANSVAGVLKMYLRELREPPFPLYLFDQLTDCVKSNASEMVDRVRPLLSRLPSSSLLLLRFLFGFLSHLCDFCDENMMEPQNVAICLGPTLLPIPEGKDQVFYHNFVNELVRSLIVNWEAVFPTAEELPGPLYDKFKYARDEAVSCAEEDVHDGEGEETDVEEEGRICAPPLAANIQELSISARCGLSWEGSRPQSAECGGGWTAVESAPQPPLFSLREQLHHARNGEDRQRLGDLGRIRSPNSMVFGGLQESEERKTRQQPPDLLRESVAVSSPPSVVPRSPLSPLLPPLPRSPLSPLPPLTPLTPLVQARPCSPQLDELSAMIAALNE